MERKFMLPRFDLKSGRTDEKGDFYNGREGCSSELMTLYNDSHGLDKKGPRKVG